MMITVREVNGLLMLRSDPDPDFVRDLYRQVLEAVDMGAQDARLLARAALTAERLLPPTGSME